MNARRNTTIGGTAKRARLTARSVVASTLLGLDPPEMGTSALVAGAELLGISAGTARVAISRMVASGELEPTIDGYRLAGHLLRRRARQELSRRGAPSTWDGRWACAVAPAEARPADERQELRDAMASLRFAPVRDGAWMRPANLAPGLLPEAEAIAAASTITTLGTVEGGRAIVARLWDLEKWAEDAQALIDEVVPLQARLDQEDTGALAPSFVAAAATLRHLQADPLLPPELLPASWPGTELRSGHARFEATFRRVLRGWHLARAARDAPPQRLH